MASRWKGPCDEDDERPLPRPPLCENDPPEWGCEGGDCPPGVFLASAEEEEEEPFSWPGPKTLRLRRTSQGFGFTLRHFIVYPPESAVHHPFLEEEVGRRGRPRNRLEPMDTIFVKQVKEGGPAHGAGLCTGDRIVKVNGASIIGKTYSEVIGLIQNSDAVLELCVMPKDEDILQLAYSQDAYLRGHSAYNGNARHIPEPPPLCYARVDCKPPGMAQATDSPRPPAPAPPDLGYRQEITVPPSPPPPPRQTVVVLPADVRLAPGAHRADYPDPAFLLLRGRPASVAQYPPPPRKADVAYPPPPHYPPAAHQNIDWRTYQTYREYIDNKGIHSHASRTIQERLDSLRAAAGHNAFNAPPHLHLQHNHAPRGGWGPSGGGMRRRSTSHDRAYHPPHYHHHHHGPPPPVPFLVPPRSASQDRMGATAGSQARNWPPRSASQDGLAHRAAAAARRASDYADPADLRRSYAGGGRATEQGPRPGRQPLPREAVLHRQHPVGYRGASNPPLYAKGPEQQLPPPPADRPAHPGRGHAGANANGSHAGRSKGRSEGGQPAGDAAGREGGVAGAAGFRSSSCSAPGQRQQRPGILKTHHHHQPPNHHQYPESPAQTQTQGQVNGRSPSEGGGGGAVVVLREKPPAGKNGGGNPLRHPSYILAVNEEGAESAVSAGAACWLPNDARREMHMSRLSERRQTSGSSNLDESLDAIPFIDEPASPSVDHEAAAIPASAVISVAPAMATGPPSPASPCPLIRRQLSHDQESLRNAILESENATKTERSKSYDEGLDNYREEGRGRSSSKHMHGLRGLRKALDGHKSSDDSGSRRDSSSDIFSDSSKEGWLNFRQLNTDKNKRVGGGRGSWKQMYAVLRGHALTLYKDKKEGLCHAAAAPTDEDPQPISVKACLIDISYSDTKRKHVLRLTTSDCEYLFQAEGRDDMLTWIRVIQESSNLDQENAAITSQDLISRKIKEYNTMMSAPCSRTEPSPKTSRQSLSIKQAFLGGKGEGQKSPHSPKAGDERRNLRDDPSPPRDRAAWRRGIPGIMRKNPFEKKPSAGVTFGVRLDDCPPAQAKGVPLIVEVCCKLVEERGLEYTGIYRVPGNNAAISSMQDELNSKGMADIDIQEDKWRDLNVISSLLKSFFRKLPEPLFTNEKYADFIDANRTEDSVERLKVLKRLILELPEHHYETLKFLSGHLKKVSENCEKNKMEPRNLAIVFGPTLVRTSEDNMTNMVNHMPDQCKIVENLIQQYDWFFTEDGDEDPVTSAEQESTVRSQPVPNIDHLLSNIGRNSATSPGEVSDSACSDSSKSKGVWGGKDQCSREMLRSSFFVSRKRKKPKDKAPPSSSDDDLDSVFPRKELPEPGLTPPPPHGPWSAAGRHARDDEDEEEEEGGGSAEQLAGGKGSRSSSPLSRPSPSPKHVSSSSSPGLRRHSPSPSPGRSYRHTPPALRQASLSDPASNYEDAVSDLGTLNSTSSKASARARHGGGRGAAAPEGVASGPAAEVCSITSDYSTTSSMTFLTGAELNALSPEVRSVAESRGGDDADDERSELVSEGRPVETDSESDLSVFVGGGQEAGLAEDSCQPDAPRPLPSHRLIECDTLSRKKSARQKTDSESSLDGGGGRSDKESGRPARGGGGAVRAGRSTGSLSSSSRSESERAEPAWRLKITDRLKFRLRTSADDMFGVGAQRSRSPEGGGSGRGGKKKNIRRRHTMGGQRDFAELSVLGGWREAEAAGDSRSELSAVDRLKPKCSSQDFSIREWIARERHRASNPEVSLDFSTELPQGGVAACAPDPPAPAEPPSSSSSSSSPSPAAPQGAGLANGDTAPQGKSLSLSATAHPHKLSGAQVVHSRFYQYL